MKGHFFKYIAGFIALFTLASCEDVIQVKLDQGSPILTIDAFVNDMRQSQKVRLTYTDGYFSQKPNQPVSGATVKVTDVTDGVTFNFTDNGNGDYVLPINPGDTIGRVGHTYRLDVLHQGITYTSTTKLNRTAYIDSIDVKKDSAAFSNKKGYRCSFFGIDPPGAVPDYYWVKSYRNNVFFGKGGEINITENGGGGTGTDGLFFIPPVAEGITPFGEYFQIGDVCRVEIHSITKETFDFLTQVQAQTTNSGLFATTPENVKTNISTNSSKVKIVGWFSMSAVNWKEKTVTP
ncbi:MAG: DUF4249 domain-containing protein [Bacteroidetes bacterium]|nr:DUF4249 domain-containing protein [Bacteroidota bacterium]